MNVPRLVSKLLAAAFVFSITQGAIAQPGGGAPTRIVIGFPPGGALDTMARSVAEKLRLASGAPVLVENIPGAGTRLAVQHVKRAAPDGKTILIGPASPFTMMPLIYKKLDYDPDKDFIPVAELAQVPTAVAVGANQPYKTFPEYVDWLRKNPDKTGFGVIGLGNSSHMALINFGKSIGVPITPVAYKGGSPLFSDVMAGHVPIGLDAIGSQIALHRSGKLRIIGVTGATRFSALPDIPTLAEEGYPALSLNVWYAAFVPAGTPREIVDKLEKTLSAAVQEPAFRAHMETAGLVLTGAPGAKVGATILAERNALKPLVDASGFKAED